MNARRARHYLDRYLAGPGAERGAAIDRGSAVRGAREQRGEAARRPAAEDVLAADLAGEQLGVGQLAAQLGHLAVLAVHDLVATDDERVAQADLAVAGAAGIASDDEGVARRQRGAVDVDLAAAAAAPSADAGGCACDVDPEPEPDPESVASDSVVQPQSVSITDLPGKFESVW